METLVLSIAFGGEIDPDEFKSSIAKALPDSVIQTVDSKAAVNAAYVDMIAAQTLHAIGSGSLLARKPEVDLLLRLARTTQISRAIDLVGTKEGKPFVLVVAGPARQLKTLQSDRMGGTKLRRRHLSPDELEKIEGAALLNVEKA